MTLRYMLTVLTNGRTDCLERTLAAFEQMVSPRPERIFIHIDGPHGPPPLLYGEMPWEVSQCPTPVGFTYATDDCYRSAVATGLPWCFHLEDDFVLLRPLDLRDIATVLDENPHLAQMALVRAPWGHEIPYGGYIAQNADAYEREAMIDISKAHHRRYEWMETTRNWATNPALMRTEFLAENPWPLEPHSEGVYGFQIRDRNPDAKFGLWGWGECWCAHVGVDRVRGAHGY